MMSMLSALPPEKRLLAETKFRILAEGIHIAPAAELALQSGKEQLRTRSGVSGGIDFDLGQNVFANAPVGEPHCKNASLLLDYFDGRFSLVREGIRVPVRLLPEPAFYRRDTKHTQRPLKYIAQMCSGDRLCFGLTGPGCFFWGAEKRCAYCTIGSPLNPDLAKKNIDEFFEVADAAINDPVMPAKHILLGGGTPSSDDMGAVEAAKLCHEIKTRYSISVYVMIAAPLKNEYIDHLVASGADEIGFNLEFWNLASWKKWIPGKDRAIGRERYLNALEYCVSKIGPIRTRSILIAGLESLNDTVEGVRQLTKRGVMPIISPFRALKGAELSNREGPSLDFYSTLFEESLDVARKHDIPLGPTCIHCQNNVLALPFDEQMRYY